MEIFNRVEQKYVLTYEQYNDLFLEIKDYIEKDQYYKSKICNLYFDNDNNDFIINSLEKPPTFAVWLFINMYFPLFAKGFYYVNNFTFFCCTMYYNVI